MGQLDVDALVRALISPDAPCAAALVRNGRVVAASRGARLLLGPRCADRPLSACAHVESREKLERALQSESPISVEVVVENPDCELCVVVMYVVPVGDERLILLHLAQSPDNVDGARELARRSHELEVAQAQLRELLSIRDEMMTALSHDLRNAMQTMVMSANMLARSSSPEVRTQAERLLRSARRAIFLTANVVESARAGSPDAVLATAPVVLGELIDEVIDGVRPFADQQRVLIEPRISSPPPVVIGDRARLLRALSNLVDNAIRHSPEGGSVSVVAEPTSGGRVRCAVLDSGPGVPPEMRERIFERFRQGGRPGSAGLGLSIARRIAELHGGRLFVDESYQRGAAFVLEIPAMVERGET
jgi:signal transduction histidine kinase